MKVLDLDGLKHLLQKFHERITTNFAAKEHTHPYAGAYNNVPGGAAYSTLRLKSDQDDSYALFCKGENTLYMHFDAKDETAELQKANIGVNREGRAYVAANGTGITDETTHLIYDTVHKPTYTDVGAAAADHTHHYPEGFDGNGASIWGVQTGTKITSWKAGASELQFRKNCPKSGQLSLLVDGEFYAQEGQKRCYHEGDVIPITAGGTGAKDAETARANLEAAAKDHTHEAADITDLSDTLSAVQEAATQAQSDALEALEAATQAQSDALEALEAASGAGGKEGKDGVGIGDITVTVDNKSSDSPTCTVTPGVEAEGKQPYTLAFSGLKGAAGSAGADGKGVGTITVTSDNTTSSTPTCTVTSSDSGTTRNYTFAFKGLKGAQGVKGDNGTNGSRGTDGKNGSTWYSGTGITGTTTTGSVFSSSGVSSALVNDYYLNTSTGYVYQCTTAGSASTAKWTYKGSIKGATGSRGSDGTDGSDGIGMGTITVTSDSTSLTSPTCTVTSSTSGTNKNYTLAFKGLKGTQGVKGDNGTDGKNGSTWYSGTGVTGTSTSGTTFSSSGVSSAVVNDYYLNTSTGNVYQCTVAGSSSTARWAYKGCIKGAQGTSGTNGTKGSDGVGMGTITVTSDSTSTSPPTCTVTSSTSGTSKNYTLAFKGLKGAQGVKGDNGTDGTGIGTITVTVDNTSSTSPTCTVTSSTSGTNKNFTLAFKGLKGKDGTSASSSKLDAWPVGSIYLSQKSTSPASLFGGSWVQVQNGRFLKAGTTQGNPFQTGGIDSLKLTASHIPSHSHAMYLYDEAGSQTTQVVQGFASGRTKLSSIQTFQYGTSSDKQLALDNKPEYIEVFVWYRTA